MPTVSAEQGGANAHNGLRIPNFRPRQRAAQIALLAVLLWPTLLTGKLRYLHLLAPMEALPRSWPLLRLPLLLLLALPLVGWVLISAGRPRARLLIVFPLGAAVILDLCFMFLHAIRGAARWMPAELGFAVLEGLPLLGYAVLVLLCLRYWQPK